MRQFFLLIFSATFLLILTWRASTIVISFSRSCCISIWHLSIYTAKKKSFLLIKFRFMKRRDNKRRYTRKQKLSMSVLFLHRPSSSSLIWSLNDKNYELPKKLFIWKWNFQSHVRFSCSAKLWIAKSINIQSVSWMYL